LNLLIYKRCILLCFYTVFYNTMWYVLCAHSVITVFFVDKETYLLIVDCSIVDSLNSLELIAPPSSCLVAF